MPPGTFYPQIRQDLFDTCENRDRVYLLLAFDIWICNVDRHDQNLLVRVVRPRGGGERRLLLLNDHGHCLVQPSQTPANLAGALEALPAQYIRLPFLSGAVTDIAAFRQAVAAIEALEESVLRGLVGSIPTRLLSEADGRVVEEFLLNRRSRLRTVLNSGRTVFPNLQGGDL